MSLGRRTAPTLVNKQFNSPIKLYSPENVQEALNKQAQVLANGAIGIDFHHLAAPNLANSAVLKMLEEEERQRGGKGLKRVAWPPPPEQTDHITEQPVYSKVTVNSAEQPQDNTWEKTFDQVPSPPLQNNPPQLNNQFYPPPQQQVYQPQLPPPPPPPPATVQLRPTAPVSQAPPPIYESQPAATKAVGPKMRGDEKWPPVAYKEQAAAENEARKALAKGPAFRPKKVKKDYRAFFAQNALTPNYPTYKAPPGTQHYIEEGTSTF